MVLTMQRKYLSCKTARFIIFVAFALVALITAGDRMLLDFPIGSASGRIWAGLLLAALLGIFGVLMTALLILGSNSQLQLRWPGFARWSVDFALMPLTLPVLVLICFAIGHRLVMYLATPWIGDEFTTVLSLELGWFLLFAAMPYAPFLWPILHRLKRTQSADGTVLAPQTWMVACGLGLFPLLLPFARPSSTVWLISCLSWLCFCSIYHYFLRPRAPRYTMSAIGSTAARNAG